jgi:hypothetical protein
VKLPEVVDVPVVVVLDVDEVVADADDLDPHAETTSTQSSATSATRSPEPIARRLDVGIERRVMTGPPFLAAWSGKASFRVAARRSWGMSDHQSEFL